MNNPYNPSFGKLPERFLGREIIVDEILSSLDELNSPWRTTLIIGVRGSGKTAILSDVNRLIKGKKVIIVSMTPEADFLEDILGQLYRNIPKPILASIPKPKKLSFAGFQVETADSHKEPSFTNTFRYQITSMLEILKKKKYKVMFLLDESQRHSDHMRTFIATYQHLIREEFEVFLVMAGLPGVISDILNDDVLTFLRRANQVELQSIDTEIVRMDYSDTFQALSVSDLLIAEAANSTKGYPYLIQLIGYYLWRYMSADMNENQSFQKALTMSKSNLNQNVHKMIYLHLSDNEKEFVHSMILDDAVSHISELESRTGRTKNHLSSYRIRLIESGYIKAVGHGKLAFVLPYTKEFLESVQKTDL
jgi:energy-coupling factor transporter ATP-binding protein EcfA2